MEPEVYFRKNDLKYSARSKAETMVGKAVINGCKVTPYGSAVTATRKVGDYDFLVHPQKRTGYYSFIWLLKKNGFEEDGSKLEGLGPSEWTSMSYTSPEGIRVNFIVVANRERYLQLHAANLLVHEYNITLKSNRIKLADHFTSRHTLTVEELEHCLNDEPDEE